MSLTLVIGGISSGKSRFAEELAMAYGPSVVYLATGSAGDAEMAQRIADHQSRRPDSWETVESPHQLAEAIEPYLDAASAVLLDDLGFVVTALLLQAESASEAEASLRREEAELWSLAAERSIPLLVVTSEVGLSLVPPSQLGRDFADLLGQANQRWASEAERVYLVVAGQALALKGG